MLEMKINFCRLITFAALFGTLSFLRAQEPPTPTIATYAGLTFTEANSGHWTIEATSDLSRDGGWSVVADNVIVLRNGRVHERGTVTELTAGGGWFAEQLASEQEDLAVHALISQLPIGRGAPAPHQPLVGW